MIMKRLFFIAAAALLAASCATIRNTIDPVHTTIVRGAVEPAMVGTWVNDEELAGDDRTGKVHDQYTFNSDGTFSQTGTMTIKMEKEDGTYTFEIATAGGGAYGVENGKIFFDYYPKLASAELAGFDTKAKNPATASKTANSIKTFTIVPMKVSIKSTMGADQVYTLDSVNDSELIISNTKGNDRKPQVFTKIK